MGATTTFLRPDSSTAMRISLARFLTHSSIVVADLIAFIVAGALAVIVRYIFHGEFTLSDYLTFTPSIIIFFVVFAMAGLYPGLAISPIEEFGRILRASTIVFLLIIGATFFLREGLLSSRIAFILAWLFTIVLVPMTRRTVRGWCSLQPWWGIPTVILGEPHTGLMMLNLLEGHPRIGLKPVALLSENAISPALTLPQSGRVFSGDLSCSASFAKDYPNSYAIIAMPSVGSARIKAIFEEYVDQYQRVLVIPDLFGVTSLSVSAKDLCGMLALEVNQKLTRNIPQIVKRSFDLAICIALGTLFSPLIAFLYLALKLTSPGPAFYGHTRIGRNNKEFKVWKFRSMVVNADAVLTQHLDADPLLREEWELCQKLRRDPRITVLGRILRKTSLDELPQLWNVIRGQMSLVGPRPIVHSEVEKYGRIYRQYLRVTPGITGLWQISGRNNTTYEMRTKIDDYYVRNWSITLDIYILARTFKTVFLIEGAY
jgi:Undecaprenyl-phosphate galactose phosphotransferase WbaP